MMVVVVQYLLGKTFYRYQLVWKVVLLLLYVPLAYPPHIYAFTERINPFNMPF